MATKDDVRVSALTIHLARADKRMDQLLSEAGRRLVAREIRLSDADSARIYVQSPHSNPPRWADFFEGYVDKADFGKNASTSAVLLVYKQNRIFALTFGRGLSLIDEEQCEERFGLKVALNCIGDGTVRTLDKHSLDQLLRHSREQASRDATAAEFGLDIEQDLLRAVTGRPSDEYYGSRIAGADSLHVSVPIKLAQLPEFLERIAEQFTLTTYQRNFGWIDHIAEVSNRQEHESLDQELARRISLAETGTIWMAVPELISWEHVAGFKFPARQPTAEHTDIHLDQLVEALGGETLTPELLRSKRIRAVDPNGDTFKQWSAYKCLYAEMEQGNDSFVLSSGRWYKVRSSFVADINSAYDNIPVYPVELPECNETREDEYLKRVADSNGFALMDQQTVFYGGGQSQIEFCDLFNRSGDYHSCKTLWSVYGVESSVRSGSCFW